MPVQNNPIPVFLVTGFLGSGKTTFLRRLAETQPEKQMVFLVNELAELDVDGAALAGLGRPTHAVVGGSVFCECKAGDFLRVMKEEVLPLRDRGKIDAVVIETSGTADPEAIGSLFGGYGLENDYAVKGIVTIVAPRRFETLYRNLPVVEAQIRGSDRIVLNKTDLCEAATVDEVEAIIRHLNPRARIERATHCRVAFDWFERTEPLPDKELFPCEANPFTSVVLAVEGSVSESALRQWLEDLPEFVYRAKGVVRTENGPFRVERTVDGTELLPVADDEADNRIVVIVPDEREEDLEPLLRQLPIRCAAVDD